MGEPVPVDFARLFAGVPAPYVAFGPDLRIVAASDAYLAATATTREAIVGRGLFEVFPVLDSSPDGEHRLRASIDRVIETRRPDTVGLQRYDVSGRDGSRVRWLSLVHTPVLDEDGDVAMVVQRADDVTALVREIESGEPSADARALLARAAGLELELLARARDLGEANRRLIDAKARLERGVQRQTTLASLGQEALHLGHPDALVARTVAVLAALPGIDFCQVLEASGEGGMRVRSQAGEDGAVEIGAPPSASVAGLAGRLVAGGRPVRLETATADGAPADARARMAATIGDHDAPIGVLVAGSHGASGLGREDCAFLAAVANVLAGGIEVARREAAMARRALHDELTGLPNRKLLLDRLAQSMAKARRDRGTGALALLDLDGFKAVNDTMGHHAGDAVLREVSSRLVGVLRGSDTVARLGGDEFALLLPDVSGREEADRVAVKVLAALEAPMALDDHEIHMGASVGLALYPQHGDDHALLLRRADAAMYVAKRAGSGHAIYVAEHDDSRHRRRSAVAALRRAIDDSRLSLHYQPKFRLADHSVCGLEALVRWQHPERGLVAPDEFIPLAEESGLIRPLTMRVLRSALAQAREWREDGLGVPVAINLSADVLQDPDVVDTLLGSVRQAGVPATALELDVTEQAFMARPGAALATIAELAGAGIRTSMDDFGTGQSSLAYLQRLSIHELKIDRSVLLEREGPDQAAMAGALIDLAHNFDLAVVGEGIESREVCHALRHRGCDLGQGYHLQRPLPASEMTEWLRRRRAAPAPAPLA